MGDTNRLTYRFNRIAPLRNELAKLFGDLGVEIGFRFHAHYYTAPFKRHVQTSKNKSAIIPRMRVNSEDFIQTKRIGINRCLKMGMCYEAIAKSTGINIADLKLYDDFRIGLNLKFIELIINLYVSGVNLEVIGHRFKMRRSDVSDYIRDNCERLGYRFADLKKRSISVQRDKNSNAEIKHNLENINLKVGENVIINEPGFFGEVNSIKAKIVAIGNEPVFPAVKIAYKSDHIGEIESWLPINHVKKIAVKPEIWPIKTKN